MNYVLTENAVGKIRRAITPSAGNTGAVGANGRPIDPDVFPAPFTVRWSASEWWINESSPGSWVVWLPNPQKMVWYNGNYIPPLSNSGTITIHGQTYPSGTIFPAEYLPAGWYRMGRTPPSTTAVRISVVGTYWMFNVEAVSPSSSPQFRIAEVGYANGRATVKQIIDSAIVLDDSGGGGTVALDDVSTDWNTGNQAQIKDWDTGTPASSTTIAQDIHAGNTTAQGAVVERTTGGVLQYKKPGTLAQLLGSSVSLSSQKILTGLRWDTSSHQLVISSANITVANGVITAWTANANENIETTAISSIIN